MDGRDGASEGGIHQMELDSAFEGVARYQNVQSEVFHGVEYWWFIRRRSLFTGEGDRCLPGRAIAVYRGGRSLFFDNF